jgi:hypothetical protein
MVFIASEKSSLHPSSFDFGVKDCILDGAFYGVIFIANFNSVVVYRYKCCCGS